jgi:DEAD/DEAH box helicase domain-containing protein
VLRTTALWFEVPKELEDRVIRGEFDLAGGIHAVEHAAIGLLPLFAMCDRWDIGGVSYPLHPQTELPTIFIYDGYPGGVGFAQKGYELLDSLMEATLRTIEECACEDGCPSCIQSPKCGNMNRPLDKATAIFLLKSLIGRPGARVARGAQR